MLKLDAEAQKVVLGAIGLPDDQIAATIKEDGIEIQEVPGYKIFAAEDFSAYETNLKKEVNKNSRMAGIEIALKQMAEEAGLSVDGKDPKTFYKDLKAKIEEETGKQPHEIKKQLEAEKQQLQGKLTEWETKYNSLLTEKQQAENDGKLFTALPDSLNISKENAMLIIKSKLGVVDDEGEKVYQYNGKNIQDDKLNNLGLKEAIAYIAKQEGLIKEEATTPSGRGAGSDKRVNTNKPTTRSEAEKAWVENAGGINPNNYGTATAQFQIYMNSLIKDVKDFDRNK